MSPTTRGGHDLDPPPGRLRGARMFAREMRVTLGGVDLTPYVNNVQFATNTESVQIDAYRSVPGPSSMSMEITLEGPPDVLMGRPRPQPVAGCTCFICEHESPTITTHRRDTHAFEQNEEDLPAQLCSECGMWPEHHNHTRSGGVCGCQECDPNDEGAGEASSGMGDSFFYRAAGSDSDRSHP